MKSENVWMIIAIIAVIKNRSSANDVQSQNGSEYQYNEITLNKWSHNTDNTTKILSITSNMYSSRILFENILANDMKNFLPFSNVRQKCTRDGRHYVAGLSNQSIWAIQMYESSAKYPSSDVELGNFDQCMSVSSEKLGIRGAYAVARIQLSRNAEPVTTESKSMAEERIPMPVNSVDMLWALCFPDSCTHEDVEESIQRMLIYNMTKIYPVTINITVSPSMYTSRQTAMPVTNWTLYTGGFFVFASAVVLAATVCDWFGKLDDDTAISITLRAFSAPRNLKSLVEDPKDKEIAVVNGLRSMGVICVITFHRIGLELGTPSFNHEFTNQIFNGFWQSFMKTLVPVETFFVLSGFFSYIVIENRLNDGKPLQFIQLLSYRIVRILPTYITAIAIFALFLPYFGDGPLWKLIVYSEAEYCQKNWWTNLLFINTYVNSEEMCMLNSWYLACDMHFFIIGIILTYLSWRWKEIGFGIFSILFAASVYIPAKYIYDNKIWGVFQLTYSNIQIVRQTEHFNKLYIKSHHRFTTYLIGMATAYIYLKIKNSKLEMSVKSRAIGFTVCMLLHIACFIVTGYFYLPDQTYNPWHHIFYFTFQRIVYSLTISYLLVVGSLSNFGYISDFVESKLFVVISRLSYVMYLMHLIVQYKSIGQSRQPFYGSYWSLYWKVNADLTTSFFYSIIINLIVEAPIRKTFQNIINIIRKNINKNSDADANTKITVIPLLHKST